MREGPVGPSLSQMLRRPSLYKIKLGYGFALVLASPFYKKQWATLKNKWLCKADLKIAKLSYRPFLSASLLPKSSPGRCEFWREQNLGGVSWCHDVSAAMFVLHLSDIGREALSTMLSTFGRAAKLLLVNKQQSCLLHLQQ